jgi:hypothetical protein
MMPLPGPCASIDTLATLQKAVRDACGAEPSCTFVDAHAACGGSNSTFSDPKYFEDTIHINQDGYYKVFELPGVQEVLGCSSPTVVFTSSTNKSARATTTISTKTTVKFMQQRTTATATTAKDTLRTTITTMTASTTISRNTRISTTGTPHNHGAHTSTVLQTSHVEQNITTTTNDSGSTPVTSTQMAIAGAATCLATSIVPLLALVL